MPSFFSDDGAAPSFVALWRKGRAIADSNPDGGAVPPSFAVRREGRAVLSSNPNDASVPSSVDDGVMPSVGVDDGAAPSSFALLREERGVVAAFVFDDAARGLSSVALQREERGAVAAFIVDDAARGLSSVACGRKGGCHRRSIGPVSEQGDSFGGLLVWYLASRICAEILEGLEGGWVIKWGDEKIIVSSDDVDESSAVAVKRAGGGLVSSSFDDAGWQSSFASRAGSRCPSKRRKAPRKAEAMADAREASSSSGKRVEKNRAWGRALVASGESSCSREVGPAW